MAREDQVLYLTKPVLSAIFVLCCLICTPIVSYMAPVDWGFARIGLGGFLTGSWCFFCLFINRVLMS